MPYSIHKKGSGYVVVTTTTGKQHEKKPTTKPKAEAQLRILQSVMNR